MKISEWLKAQRTGAGLSQMDICRLAGIDPGNYNRMEHGKLGLTSAIMKALGQIYDVKISRKTIYQVKKEVMIVKSEVTLDE